ncbi:PREDICTED: feline leukemia virus subgroup C receptor-related protein 2 isoform X2 [Habropoda laboriosa]|uniref:feline leukemia virus subgroup C receptor-related protein 2 isoform X2 n=1 Tax=Habropoda laboriosa TaxID=597456 RepID=UPI00083DFD42|nr:PREDICTED: feline leukemia virus subgroup C receptor-related protein 2 isoform X2 [Habropoda laboriosa]
MRMTDENGPTEVLCVNSPVKVINGSGKDNENLWKTKVYKRRWLMLGLFTLYTGMSSFQWVQYSIITNIITRYYGVSSLAVDWTSMAFMVYYVIFIIPATYMLDRWGLRWTNIVGCGINCLGSWIKVLSTIVLIMPGRLAAQWFDVTEISTATSLSIFGNQLGIALSFLLTPILIKNHENLDDIGSALSHLFWAIAIIISVAFLLVITLFENDPKLPPSKTRVLQKLNQMEVEESFIEPVKRLFKNKCYLLLCNSYGLGIGVFNAVGTLLNQIYLEHFEHGEEDAGRIGLAMIVAGMIGSICFGVILDKTQKFKETTVIVYFLALCGQIFFSTFACLEMKWMVYLSATFLGYFMVGYFALGYEICAEYTYPESEGITAGILNVGNNVYGIVLVLIMGRLLEVYGDIPVHVGLCTALLVGFIMTVFTEDVQRRQDAKKGVQYVGVNQSAKSNNGLEKN